jgi:DNA-binding MarR family transcriptional regulator
VTSSGEAADPTLESAIRPLRELLSAMDADIGRLYAERGVGGVRPRFSMALIRLLHRGPMTVKELAEQIDVTHSAMSQTVTAMRREGLVATSTGSDARTRTVSLTERGRALVPFLEDEWRATERAWVELEAEIPYALTRLVDDIAAALRRRSFRERISQQLDHPSAPDDPDPGREPRA